MTVRNIYCIGRNYAAHAEELGNAVPKEEPVIFMKSSAAVRGLTDDTGTLAFPTEDFHHEVEMVVLVGSDVPLNALQPGRELSCVQAIGLGLDLTRRGVQTNLKKRGLPWTTAKSFAGSAIVSPMTAYPDPDHRFGLDEVSFDLKVNGVLRQVGHTSSMIFDVPSQLRFLNSLAPLLRGDLIFTGTPEGVDTLRQGDEFEMRFTRGPPSAKTTYHGVL